MRSWDMEFIQTGLHLPCGNPRLPEAIPGLEVWLFRDGSSCFGAPALSGTRSFIVRQTVHLKTFNPFGHRTIESQVIHFPVMRSASGARNGLVALDAPDNTGILGSLPIGSKVVLVLPFSAGFFFLWEKREGNGWLIDRPWFEEFRSSLDVLLPAFGKVWRPAVDCTVGIPKEPSKRSLSVIRELPCPIIGDLGGTSVTEELEDLCELPPPIRDVQGGIVR